MGKRPADVELFVGNMGSIQREIRASMQREDTPTMATGLERIAVKARCEPSLRFSHLTGTSHHTGAGMGESVSDSEPLGSRGGRPDGDADEGELRGMD